MIKHAVDNKLIQPLIDLAKLIAITQRTPKLVPIKVKKEIRLIGAVSKGIKDRSITSMNYITCVEVAEK